MKKLFLTIAALALPLALPMTASAFLAVTGPAATKFQSSLTDPGSGGSDFLITKPSSIMVTVGKGVVTFKLKLNGVMDNTTPPGTLANQTTNTLQVDLRYHGALRTVSFDFDLAKGKTNNSLTKFPLADGSLPSGGVAPGDPIEVRAVRCIQGGSGAGAGNSFCAAGVTAK